MAGAGEIIKSIQGKIDALKAVKDSNDTEAIKKALSELSAELQKIGAHMNSQANQPSGTEEPKNGGQDPSTSSGQDKESATEAKAEDVKKEGENK